MDEIKLTPGSAGWVFADWGKGAAWVKLGFDQTQKKLRRIEAVCVLSPTPPTLARVPLNRIRAMLTMRGAGVIQLALAMGLNDRPPDVSRRPSSPSIALQRRFRLKRPEGKLLDDDFYRDVAHAYQSAIAFGLRPRKAIVGDTGMKDATVAGWVLEARRRGYLPKTQPGKISTNPTKARGD